jgi:hypothetical protein
MLEVQILLPRPLTPCSAYIEIGVTGGLSFSVTGRFHFVTLSVTCRFQRGSTSARGAQQPSKLTTAEFYSPDPLHLLFL